MNDFQASHSRSEIFQSPDNLDIIDQHHNLVVPDPDTYSLSYDSVNKDYNQINTNQNNAEIESDLNFAQNDENTDNDNKNEEEEEVHTVSMVVTIVAAFPAETDKESIYEAGANKPRATEGPKPQNFYKFEYQLLPDDTEPIVADLVTYKIAAKLYPEKSEPKVIKSWEHEKKIWIVWSQTHELKLTKSRLLKLFDHELVLKIWDTRDYCAARTKFDKPKPFKFSKSGDNVEENIRSVVFEQCDNYLKQIPKELHKRMNRKLPNQIRLLTPSEQYDQEITEKTTNTLVAVPSRNVLSALNSNKLSELISDTNMIKSLKHLRNNSNRRPKSKSTKKSNDLTEESKASLKKVSLKSKREIAAELDFIKKNGVARVKLKMKILFAGYSYLASRITETTSTVEDCLVSVSLENSLMSEHQLVDLNPLSITLQKITNMPNEPVKHNELKEKCEPVYCSYSFFKQPIYRTLGIAQEENLFYNDINVYLTGLLNKQELIEFLCGVPFEIEIHDRNRKPVEKESQRACLFGNDALDENISNVNSIASKQTLHNPFETKLKCWDPFGIARLNLNEFVLGKKLIEYFVPILPCAAPDALGRNASKVSSNTKSLGDEDVPMQAGSFLDSNTHLNMKISVARPLFDHKKTGHHRIINTENTCVFSRIIVKINSNKLNVVKLLIENILKVNAEALNLGHHPKHVQEAAISTHKLTEEEQMSKTLDLITGFRLVNGQNHLFILEGINDLGIRYIYEQIPRIKNDSDIECLYDSSLCFSTRLYSNLDLDLLTVKLFESLEEIVKKPLLYIRDMTPKTSFEALIKLNQLMSEYRLKNVIRCDLLPTAEMIFSMSKEFGIPLNEADVANSNSTTKKVEMAAYDHQEYAYNENDFDNIPHTSRIWTPIDNDNTQYLKEKQEKLNQIKNFVSNNIQEIHETSEKNKENKPVKKYILADGFSYSSSTCNATEQALDKFRDYINKNTPNVLYSYNPQYHNSMTFVPVNLKKLEKEEKKKSISKWRSTEGWIFPDVKTTMQCNQHPKKPDQASLDRLKESWDENNLHAFKMKSPLDGREFFKGKLRPKDFNVWSKPKDELEFPITIFEAGTIKENEEKQVLLSERELWKKKLLVDDPEVKVHKLLGATESKISGLSSSNQLDKLKGLLKDEPKKKGLLAGGVTFNNIPALSVTKPKYVEQENFLSSLKGFNAGDSSTHRITDDNNKIPVFNYERSKYERLRGSDFNLNINQNNSPVYRRRLDTLKTVENAERPMLKSQMFIIPNQSDLDKMSTYNKSTILS